MYIVRVIPISQLRLLGLAIKLNVDFSRGNQDNAMNFTYKLTNNGVDVSLF